MNSRDFTYWLQGFFELSDENVTLSQRQLKIIKDHLNLMFDKETPDYTKEGGDEVIISSPPTEPWKVPAYTKSGMYRTQDLKVESPLGSDPAEFQGSC